jgi:hypothetical protein
MTLTDIPALELRPMPQPSHTPCLTQFPDKVAQSINWSSHLFLSTLLFINCWSIGTSLCQAAEPTAGPQHNWELVDQFGEPHSLRDYSGEVLVLVYGDRKATKSCRKLGEALHVEFHPEAQSLPEAEGHKAAVKPVAGISSSARSPEVRVIPVACTGHVPAPVQKLVSMQFRKGSPHVPVWLDFDQQMRPRYGLESGEPHVLVFDGAGELRVQTVGSYDDRQLADLFRKIEALRTEIIAR